MILPCSFELIYLMLCNKKQIIQLLLLVKTKAAFPAQNFTNTAQYNYYQQVHSKWFFKFLGFWTLSTVLYLQQNIFNTKRWTKPRDMVTLSKLASVLRPTILTQKWPLTIWLGGRQSQSGSFTEEKISCPCR